MPSYLVPALYYSTNLSDVVLALLGPGFAMCFLSCAASAVLTVRAQNRAKEGRKSFMNPQKRYNDNEDTVGGGGGFGRDCSSFHMTMEVHT